MRVYVVLRCGDRLAPKARYVLSTFCRVLGLDMVEVPQGSEGMLPSEGLTVWYGAASDVPAEGAGLVWIHCFSAASTFFADGHPRRVEDVMFAYWQDRLIPFVFGLEPGRKQVRPLESDLANNLEPVVMPYDLISSAFYFLSRWEETVIQERDEHGRFPFTRSLAAQLDLSENIVDIYLDLFIALLKLAGGDRWDWLEIPMWNGGAPFAICLSHDVDEVRKSRLSRLKFLWDHSTRPEIGHRNTPFGDRVAFALSTLFSRQDPYWTFPGYATIERRLGFNASYFFQAGDRDAGTRYSLSEPRVQSFIYDLLNEGFEVGLHGSYRSAFDEARFLQEKRALAAVIEQEPVGHRQHYLRMEYTVTLPIYERAGVKYDATLGYAEHEGYRNQFSYPYHPYHHGEDRAFRFLELPTVIMDVTLGSYRELSAAQAWQVIERWLERTCLRRGCLTLLWHNPWDGILPGYSELYPRTLFWIQEHGGLGVAGSDILDQWLARQ
jgi:hypothetical protein